MVLKLTLIVAKMAGVEVKNIERMLSNPPRKVSEDIKYKVAVTVMSLRFFLKDCEQENINCWEEADDMDTR